MRDKTAEEDMTMSDTAKLIRRSLMGSATLPGSMMTRPAHTHSHDGSCCGHDHSHDAPHDHAQRDAAAVDKEAKG